MSESTADNLSQARMLLEVGQYERARELVQTVLESEPDSERARELEQAAKKGIQEIRRLRQMALRHEENGELDRAVELWEKLLSQSPTNPDASRDKQALVLKMEVAAEAITQAEDAARRKSWSESLAHWESALRLWPGNPAARNGFAEAEETYERFNQFRADARRHLASNDLSSAVESLKKAAGIGLWPEADALLNESVRKIQTAETLVSAGMAAAENADWKGAASKLEEAWALNHESVDEAELQRVQSLASQLAESLTNSIDSLNRGKPEEAILAARKGLELKDLPRLREILSRAEQEIRLTQELATEAAAIADTDPEAALGLWQEALTYQPGNNEIRGHIQVLQERIATARRMETEARRWAKKGRWKKAWKSAMEATALNPRITQAANLAVQAAASHEKRIWWLNRALLFLSILSILFGAFVIQRQQRIRRFHASVDEGQAAFVNRNWAAATRFLEQARSEALTEDQKNFLTHEVALARMLERVNRNLENARQYTEQKRWKDAAVAYDIAREKLSGIPEQDRDGRLSRWLKDWEEAEFQMTLSWERSVEFVAQKQGIWKEYVRKHPNGRRTAKADTRLKAIALRQYEERYSRLTAQFNEALRNGRFGLARTTEKELARVLSQVREDGMILDVKPENSLDAIRKVLAEAPLKYVDTRYFFPAQELAEKEKDPRKKLLLWQVFQKEYPGHRSELVRQFIRRAREEIHGEYLRAYQRLNKRLGELLLRHKFEEAARQIENAKQLIRQAADENCPLRISFSLSPGFLRQRLEAFRVQAEIEAFEAAKKRALAAKGLDEQIKIWTGFTSKYPESTREPLARSAIAQSCLTEYNRALAELESTLGKAYFRSAPAAIARAENVLKKAQQAGVTVNIPAGSSPEALRKQYAQWKAEHGDEARYRYASQRAGKLAKIAKFEDALKAWSGFLGEFPDSDLVPKAVEARKALHLEARNHFVQLAIQSIKGKKFSRAWILLNHALRFRPEDRVASTLRKQVVPELIGQSELFEIPAEKVDWRSNPVRSGMDSHTGLPLEIRCRKTGAHLMLVRDRSGIRPTAGGKDVHFPIDEYHYFGKYEVTEREIQLFGSETQYLFLTRQDLGAVGQGKETEHGEKPEQVVQGSESKDKEGVSDDLPAIKVSLIDAEKFLQWLNRGVGGAIFRLPTFAEWENACRGGKNSLFFWGQDPMLAGQYANIADLSFQKVYPGLTALGADDGFAFIAPVGSKKPNAFGLYDTIGNVREWCSAEILGPGRENREATACGGSWFDDPKSIQNEPARKHKAATRLNTIGFRLVVDAEALITAVTAKAE